MFRISIVIPCHNYGRYLSRALDSIVGQEDPDWEAIVVDDGSSDDSAEIARAWARSYPDRIRCLRQDHAGPGAARNAGARASTGEWRLFLDADDALLTGALARYRSAVADHPDTSLVVAGAHTVRDGTVVSVRRAGVADPDRIRNFAAFVRGRLCPFNGGSVLVHRRVTERLSYPERIRTSEDFVFFAQALSLFDCSSAGEPAVAIHRHSGSLRYDPDALDAAVDSVIDLLFDPAVVPAAAMRYKREVESGWLLVVSRALYLHGRYREARRCYRRGIGMYPRHIARSGYLGKFFMSLFRSARRSTRYDRTDP
jgi:glycosyltransferase involved in cell wall biosynthesis